MNICGLGQAGRRAHNRLKLEKDAVEVSLGADGLDENDCTTGGMAFSVMGGDKSYVVGSHRASSFLRSWWSRYGLKTYSYYYGLRDTGELPNLDGEIRPEMPEDFSAQAMTSTERRELLRDLMRHPLCHQIFERVSRAQPALLEDEQALTEFLDDLALHLRKFSGNWGESALCSRSLLPAQGETNALFTVSWFFPNHISPTGERLGHMYENWFADASEVNGYLRKNFDAFRERTLLLPRIIYDSSLDDVYGDAVTSQLSTLTKCTWWTKSGHFGVWEGLGCCGFHTTDITYQGSFPIIAMFPDLQKTQMLHGAGFQREDGRVHHLFQPDFSAVDEGFDRVDMNPQFVMLAARDYLWTGDRVYLETLWPHIVSAMDNSALLDTDGDALPDTDTKRNTYDVWDFQGCPSYISSLWLGALKAAIRLANEMGDEERAKRWDQTYHRGVESLESRLWNGNYYVLWRDETAGLADDSCMSDQLSGDWFCGVMGWGTICKPARIRKALSSILRYNFKPGHGLVNASYPRGVAHRQAASGNTQAEATWTGIEYTVAALLILHGMIADGLRIVKDIHDRYLKAGRFWNHTECGDHYYRAMSSWTLLLAITGFALDVPRGELKLDPVLPSNACCYPIFAPGFVGSYRHSSTFRGSCSTVEVLSGAVSFSRLTLSRKPIAYPIVAEINGRRISCKVERGRRLHTFVFGEPVDLRSGDRLAIRSRLPGENGKC